MTPDMGDDVGPAALRRVLAARERQRQRYRHRVAERVMAELICAKGVELAAPWMVVPTVGDTVVVRSAGAAPGSAQRARVVKVALSSAADEGLRRHEQMLLHLASRGIGRSIVPEVLASGWAGPHRFVVEGALDGAPLAAAGTVDDCRGPLAAIHTMHVMSAHRRTWGPSDLAEWLGADLARIRHVVHSQRTGAAVDAVEAVLVEAFIGRPLTAGVVHGDFWPGNVLVDDGPERRVTGVVDWERGATSSLPDCDLAHFILCSHPLGFAAAVRASLGAPDATVGEWAATFGAPTQNPSLGRAACTALTWALHVGATLAERRRYGPGRLWVRREVESVLEVLGRPAVLASIAANCG